MLVSWWVVSIAGLIFLYLLLRFNSLWIYRLDRAVRNQRDSLSPAYELPRYFRVDESGTPNTRVRWPGWDGWYFFVIPRDPRLPAQMIRASVMTGLYGLNGVDNYALLPRGLSSREAVEYLILIPTQGATPRGLGKPPSGAPARQNYFAHSYLPKTVLEMKLRELDVAIHESGPESPSSPRLSGQVSGKWPEYQFHFRGPESSVDVDVRFRAHDLVWWADLPRVFTYFSAFGEFTGTMSVRPQSGPANAPAVGSGTFAIQGTGGFEHGFARKPFNFDLLYSPVRVLQKIVSGFRPIRYHYELLVSGNGLHGGWMHARGFGIDFRNRGGFYLGGDYVPIQSVDIEYEDPEAAPVPSPGSASSGAVFYRRWIVRAETCNGILEYVAKREWPAAPVAPNMTYYHHSFQGSYRGKEIRGSGYGEYLNI